MTAGQPAKPTQQDIQHNRERRHHEGARKHFGVVAGRVARDQQPAETSTRAVGSNRGRRDDLERGAA